MKHRSVSHNSASSDWWGESWCFQGMSFTFGIRSYKSTVNAQCKKVLPLRYNYVHFALVNCAHLLNEEAIGSHLNFN